jgi:hypothetical protein
LEASSGGAVDSVNGETGAVTLTAADIGSTPAGGISGNDVQEALDELDTDKLAKAGGTMTGQLVTTTGAALTPSVLVGSGAGVFNPSTDRLSLAIASGGTLAERWRFTYNQLIAYGGSNALPAYAHNLDAGTGFQPGLAGAGISVTGSQVWAWSATGADAKSLKIVNVADATLATDAMNRQAGDARWIRSGQAAIVNADVHAAAAIAYSKLALTGSIVNADLSASAAIAYSKLNLTGAILNADLAGSIAYSKLSLTGAIVNADLAGSIAGTKVDIASDTVRGTAEIATEAEVRTGTDTVRYITPATLAAVKPGSILASCVYDPGTTTTYTTTSATLGDIDTTNLTVTFTAPQSGKVLVMLTGRITTSAATTPTWGLRNGSSQAGGLFTLASSLNLGGAHQARTGVVYITSLTPGTSYTVKWAWAVSGGVTFGLKAGQTSGDEGAATMQVFSA